MKKKNQSKEEKGISRQREGVRIGGERFYFFLIFLLFAFFSDL